MNETELERLVVRLTGDGSSYMRMMEETQAHSKETAARVEEAGKKIEGITESLKGFASAAVGTLASLGAGAFLKGALDSFIKVEDEQIKMRAAIRGHGGDVDALSQSYNALATRLAETTTATRGQVMGLLRHAEAAGFSGKAAEQLTRNSIAFAAATDMSAEHAETLMIAMQRGNIQMLRRVEGFRGLKNEQDILNEVNRRMQIGMGIAEEQSKSLGGQLEKLWKDTEGVRKQFGKLVAEAIEPLVAGARSIVGWFKNLSDSTKIVVFGAIAATAAFVIFWGVLVTGAAVFNVMTGGLLTLLGLLVTGGVALGAWAGSVGGVKAAWEKFFDFFVPIWDATKSLANTTWNFIREGAAAAGNFIMSVWGTVTGNTEVNWTTVRDTVQDTILFMEFTLLNFEKVWELSWIGMQLAAQKAIRAVKVAYLTLTELPSLMDKLTPNLGSDIQIGMRIADRVLPTAAEQELQRRFDKLSAIVGQEFEAFRAAKLAEFADNGKKIIDTADKVGAGFSKASKEVHKFNAALFGSAEALERIQKFQDRIYPDVLAAGLVATVAGTPAPTLSSTPSGVVSDTGPQQVLLLTQIRDLLDRISRSPGATLGAANL